jgi:hypothetical protein
LKKPEYRRGAEARKSFESTMSKLFRVPRSEVVEKKPKPPTKKGSEGKEN